MSESTNDSENRTVPPRPQLTVYLVVHRNLHGKYSATEAIEGGFTDLDDAKQVQAMCTDAVILELDLNPTYLPFYRDLSKP